MYVEQTTGLAAPGPVPEPSPLEAAYAYAERGCFVFPLKPRGKEPLVKWKELPPPSALLVDQWRAQYPDANIGLRVPAGHFVLDVDGPEGEQTLAELQAEHGPLPPGPEARTGKGRHLWFRLPPGATLKNGVRLLPGLDVRADGGYVVAPPSVHQNGQRYAWVRSILDCDAPEAPAWLLDALEGRLDGNGGGAPGEYFLDLRGVSLSPRRDRVKAVLDVMREAVKGERNKKLHWCACRFVEMEHEGGLLAGAWEALEREAMRHGLPLAEVRKTIASARKQVAKSAAQSSPPPASPPGAPHPSGWPDPEPLFAAGSKPLPYPVDALPEVLRDAVLEYQAIGQQPLALVAGSALAAASLACQALADVDRGLGLVGPISLYLLTIAVSGERKSSADRWFKKPFLEWARWREKTGKEKLQAHFAERYLDGKIDLETLRAKIAALQGKLGKRLAELDRLRKQVADEAKGAVEEAKNAEAGADEPARPQKRGKASPVEKLRAVEQEVEELRRQLDQARTDLQVMLEALPPRLFAEDATPEALARRLAKETLSLGLWSDEGGVVVGSHAMSEETVLRFMALVNKLWSGDSVSIDRVTKESYDVHGRRLTVNLMVQPDVAHKLIGGYDGLARGIGLLARFLVCWPESHIGQRFLSREREPVSREAYERFRAQVWRCLNSEPNVAHRGPDFQELDPPRLALSDEARELWVDFHNEVERSIGRTGEFGDVQDVGAKIAEQATRLAAVFHVFEHGPVGLIERETMERAIELARWYLVEARRVLAIARPSEAVEDARLLLDWLREHPEHATLSGILQFGPARLRKKERRDRALVELAHRNLCRIHQDGRIEVSPRVVEVETDPA